MPDIVRRLPGGYGTWDGDQAYIDNASDQFSRNSLQESAGGWWVTSVGDAFLTHQESAGVTIASGTTFFFPIPPRIKSVRVSAVRLRVITSAVVGAVYTALYTFNKNNQFVRIPRTGIMWDATNTGQFTQTLTKSVDIPAAAMLFLGYWTNDATIAVTGFLQAGSKIIDLRSVITGAAIPNTSYELVETSKSAVATSVPLVAYLSRDANLVL